MEALTGKTRDSPLGNQRRTRKVSTCRGPVILPKAEHPTRRGASFLWGGLGAASAAMVHLEFTAQLHRFLDTPVLDCDAAQLGQALTQAFQVNPRLRAYILDEQGHLRTHVAVFIDGQRVQDRRGLTDPLKPGSRVYVLQALSGG